MESILIIEDNAEIRENAMELLQLEGYNVYAAADGIRGLQLANDNLPHLIISDVMMPGMNGHQIFEALKENPLTRHIPFVFLTSSVENSEIALALDKGAAGYIKKPFDDKELFETIKQCLSCKKSSLF